MKLLRDNYYYSNPFSLVNNKVEVWIYEKYLIQFLCRLFQYRIPAVIAEKHKIFLKIEVEVILHHI